MKRSMKSEIILKLKPIWTLIIRGGFMSFLLGGCASKGGLLDSLLEENKSSSSSEFGKSGESEIRNKSSSSELSGYIKYSDNPQMAVPSNRQYRHMTRQRLEEESDLHPQAGSMWISDGQGAYLFAQNKMRREGDILNIKLDGPAMRQVETKVNVIKKLLKQLEDEATSPSSTPAQTLTKSNSDLDGRGPASTSVDAGKPEVNTASKNKKDDKADLSEVQNVQTRIVEKLPDGNYRVKGQQPFMIEKKEYKVIVAGFIRPEDFTDDGVPSSKLIDPQIDVISVRRNSKNEL